jgi:hypothetical protein
MRGYKVGRRWRPAHDEQGMETHLQPKRPLSQRSVYLRRMEGRYGDPFGDHRYGKDEQWKYLRGWFDGQDFRNKRLDVYGRTEKVVTR